MSGTKRTFADYKECDACGGCGKRRLKKIHNFLGDCWVGYSGSSDEPCLTCKGNGIVLRKNTQQHGKERSL